jgi:hypothetical protein
MGYVPSTLLEFEPLLKSYQTDCASIVVAISPEVAAARRIECGDHIAA